MLIVRGVVVNVDELRYANHGSGGSRLRGLCSGDDA